MAEMVMQKSPIINQEWYEQAVEIIGSSYATPDERIAKLNEIWSEFLLNKDGWYHPSGLKARVSLSDDDLNKAFDDALQTVCGLSLQSVIDYAKEMLKNGTNETQTAVADAE